MLKTQELPSEKNFSEEALSQEVHTERPAERAILGEGWAYAAVCEGAPLSRAQAENWQEAVCGVPEASLLQQDRAGGRQSLLHKEVRLWKGILFIASVGGFPFESRTSHTECSPARESACGRTHTWGDTGAQRVLKRRLPGPFHMSWV